MLSIVQVLLWSERKKQTVFLDKRVGKMRRDNRRKSKIRDTYLLVRWGKNLDVDGRDTSHGASLVSQLIWSLNAVHSECAECQIYDYGIYLKRSLDCLSL